MVGNNVRVALGRSLALRGFTHEQLAAALGVSRERVTQWCSGTREIKADVVVKIAKALNVSADYLLGLSDVATVDLDVQTTAKRYGLSEDALNALEKFAAVDTETGFSAPSRAVNNLLTYPNSFHLALSLDKYLTAPNDVNFIVKNGYAQSDVMLITIMNALQGAREHVQKMEDNAAPLLPKKRKGKGA